MMVVTTPTSLREMITLPPANNTIIQSAINSSAGGNLLFYGPGGTGKSEFCRVIAMEAMRHSGLDVQDYRTALGYSNLSVVNHVSGYNKAALEKIRQQAQMCTLTASDRRWVIVEEFDSIGSANTNYVKTWLDEMQELDVQVFASTNNLHDINDAVRSRFSELYLGPHPNEPMRAWAAAELKRLGSGEVTDVELSQLVNNAAGSMRALKRGCYLFAENGTVV